MEEILNLFGWSDNSVYGHEKILQDYCVTYRRILGHVQHGWNPFSGWTLAGHELLRNHSRRYVWGDRQLKYSKSIGVSVKAAIGAPWLYMRTETASFNPDDSKTPLIFPFHGTGQHAVNYPHDVFLNQVIESFGTNLTIHLHANEYENSNLKSSYTKRGFLPVTSGKIHNVKFLYNLREKLVQTPFIVTNRISTVSMYAASLGIPTHFIGDIPSTKGETKETLSQLKMLQEELGSYSNNPDSLIRFSERELGINHKKSPTELASILTLKYPKRTIYPFFLSASYASRILRRLQMKK